MGDFLSYVYWGDIDYNNIEGNFVFAVPLN